MPDFASYQAAYIRTFKETTFTRELRVVPCAASGAGPSHDVYVMRQPRIWGGFVMTTNGLGQGRRAGGFELLAHTDRSGDKVPEALSDVAAVVMARASKPRAGERMRLPQLEHGPAHVVVSPSGYVAVAGCRVDLWSIIPVTEREFDHINRGDVFDWLEVHAASFEKTTELLSRWRLARASTKAPTSWRCAAQVIDPCPEPNPKPSPSASWASKY